MEDKNFATKYRPITYADVVGQEVPKSVLKKIALSPGIACRSVFLKGSWGSGKTTLARIFAKSMNCEHFSEIGDVCNSCDSCKDVMVKNSQLYMEFDATTAGNVDSIRALHDKLSYLPPKGGRRVVVLDEVHACSSSALNALLKLVEEGIPSTIFVFCSTEDILPTLKSRSICLDVTIIPPVLMSERIKEVASYEGISISESDIHTICAKSLGHMRDAMSLLQLYSLAGSEVLKTPTELIYKFIIAALKKDRPLALSLITEIMRYPTTDISASLAGLIRSIYTSAPESQMNLLLKNGMVNKLFTFFYTPVAQQALRSEVGTELLLRSFLEKTNSHG